MAYVKVKGKESLVKDPGTGVVLNTNRSNFMARRAKKAREKAQAAELETLRSEVAELKAMMEQVLTNGN